MLYPHAALDKPSLDIGQQTVCQEPVKTPSIHPVGEKDHRRPRRPHDVIVELNMKRSVGITPPHHDGQQNQDAQRSMLDARYWMLDTRCSILDVGCWIFDIRCWMFDTECWILPRSRRRPRRRCSVKKVEKSKCPKVEEQERGIHSPRAESLRCPLAL